jgi:hypothetical protein
MFYLCCFWRVKVSNRRHMQAVEFSHRSGRDLINMAVSSLQLSTYPSANRV